MSSTINLINYQDANSRETYYTMHNVKQAHKFGKGENVNVGIIDWCFGLNEHENLYAGGIDVSGNEFFLKEKAEHGYWMALALREIAPCCRIYAINYLNGENWDNRVETILKSIEWAIENNIHILTYSGSRFNSDERLLIDKAVQNANACGIITTFIHYDNENNFYPGALMKYNGGGREPDIRILHYDYNTLFINQYEKYSTMDYSDLKSGNDIPYFSISSMSPVLAGFVAILKSINSTLTLQQCKAILGETSYSTHFKGYAPFDDVDIDTVADIGEAARYVSEM